MFPHPGTRIAHPTNGCHPPPGSVLEASTNEQTKKRAEGRELLSASRYWEVEEEVGEDGGMGTEEREGTAAGMKKQSELRCGSRVALRL